MGWVSNRQENCTGREGRLWLALFFILPIISRLGRIQKRDYWVLQLEVAARTQPVDSPEPLRMQSKRIVRFSKSIAYLGRIRSTTVV